MFKISEKEKGVLQRNEIQQDKAVRFKNACSAQYCSFLGKKSGPERRPEEKTVD